MKILRPEFYSIPSKKVDGYGIITSLEAKHIYSTGRFPLASIVLKLSFAPVQLDLFSKAPLVVMGLKLRSLAMLSCILATLTKQTH